jgi:hypothetical protein
MFTGAGRLEDGDESRNRCDRLACWDIRGLMNAVAITSSDPAVDREPEPEPRADATGLAGPAAFRARARPT